MKKAILDFASANQATIAAKNLSELKLLDGLDDKLTMVLRPTDEAFKTFLEKFKLNYAAVKDSKAFADVLRNHFSLIPTKRVYPMFTATTGLTYGNSEADLKSLGAKEVLILVRNDGLKVPVIIISTVLFTTGQRERLQQIQPHSGPEKK
jgi:hypothetical protein